MVNVHSSAAHLVQLHRGHVRVWPLRTVGVRARFVVKVIRLPASPQERVQKSKPLPQEAMFEVLAVLIALIVVAHRLRLRLVLEQPTTALLPLLRLLLLQVVLETPRRLPKIIGVTVRRGETQAQEPLFPLRQLVATGRLAQGLRGSLALALVLELRIQPLVHLVVLPLVCGPRGGLVLPRLPLRQQLGRWPVHVLVTLRVGRVILRF